MRLLDLTLPTAAENVALDEALLEEAEARADAAARAGEVLRLWESPTPVVVIGRSSSIESEARRDACSARGVPIVRRTSGGAAIVSGPGCLMYGVVLSLVDRPELKSIDVAHRYVLAQLSQALEKLVPTVTCSGTSDLVIADTETKDTETNDTVVTGSASAAAACSAAGSARRKFSGNSLRLRRRHLLYHGTLLYDFDLSLVEELLPHPPREPEYRAGRRHGEFIANLPVERSALRQAVIAAFGATDASPAWPRALTDRLAREKYSTDVWNVEGRTP